MRKTLCLLLSLILAVSCCTVLGASATETEGTENGVYLLGDVDMDGEITIIDATIIQRADIGMYELSGLQKVLADEELGYNITSKGYYQGRGCQFGFPEGLTETKINWWETDKPFQNDGETFRYACVNMFKDLERRIAKISRGTISDALFKIVVEDVGLDLNGDHDYWVYLLYT